MQLVRVVFLYMVNRLVAGMYKTRTRELYGGTQTAKWQRGSSTVVNTTTPVSVVATDTLTSMGNPWPPPKALRNADMGNGAFIATRYKFSGGGAVNIGSSGKDLQSWSKSVGGILLPTGPTLAIPSIPSNALMFALGGRGFRATIPTKPIQDAAVFLGELRQLPKVSPVALKLMRDRAWRFTRQWKRWREYTKDYTKAGADEFLNQMFGWGPFLRDIDKLLTPRVEIMKRVNQLERDSGKRVRRRVQLTNTISVSPILINTSGGYGYPGGLASTQQVESQGTRMSHTVTRENAWFSAAYTYYIIPKTEMLGIPRAMQMARLIHGMSITPDVLWNLAPWSWLADYGLNIGQILSNLTSFNSDNLVALYSYVMVETNVSLDVALIGVGLKGGGSVSAFSESTATCKRRIKGSPYGFGPTPPLTAKQNAILIALGLSKL